MTIEELKRNLEYTKNKHKNDHVHTFGTDISAMCKDTLDCLEALQSDLSKSNKDFNLLLQGIKEIYPRDKGEYMDLDVFMEQIMLYVANNR